MNHQHQTLKLNGPTVHIYQCPKEIFEVILNYTSSLPPEKFIKRHDLDNSGSSYIHESGSLQSVTKLDIFHSWMESCINDVKSKIKWSEEHIKKIRISQSWLNLSKTGESHHHHDHPLSLLSTILYLQGAAETTFYVKSPYALERNISPSVHIHKMYDVNNIKAKPGSMIVFPSTLLHGVQANMLSTDRITLSANTWFDGEVGVAKDLTYISEY